MPMHIFDCHPDVLFGTFEQNSNMNFVLLVHNMDSSLPKDFLLLTARWSSFPYKQESGSYSATGTTPDSTGACSAPATAIARGDESPGPVGGASPRPHSAHFVFQAEAGIRDYKVTGVRRVLFR